jgi:anti-anti-sigma factor
VKIIRILEMKELGRYGTIHTMKMKEQKQNDVMNVGLDGMLDTAASYELEERSFQLIEEGNSKFIFDLTALNFIASSGLRVFLAIAKRLDKNKGRILLCGLQPDIKEVFDVSGFTPIFEIFATPEDALKSIQG